MEPDSFRAATGSGTSYALACGKGGLPYNDVVTVSQPEYALEIGTLRASLSLKLCLELRMHGIPDSADRSAGDLDHFSTTLRPLL